MNENIPRADGATRGDRVEAAALIAAGVVLICIPLLALADKVDTPWLILSLLGGLAGLLICGLGVRWFQQEGPSLESSLATTDRDFMATELADGPLELRLIEAGQRFVAHCLRFVTFATAGLLMLVDLGPLRWVVVAMFGTSFLADQWMLRPRPHVLHTDGLRRQGLLSPIEIPWSSVRAVFWSHYPGAVRPPFPSGERLILELDEGNDLEFVFRGASASDDAASMARALVKHLDSKVRILTPKRERAEVGRQDVSEHLSSSPAPPES